MTTNSKEGEMAKSWRVLEKEGGVFDSIIVIRKYDDESLTQEMNIDFNFPFSDSVDFPVDFSSKMPKLSVGPVDIEHDTYRKLIEEEGYDVVEEYNWGDENGH